MTDQNGSSNGHVRSEDRVRVAIIGVGNCANSLLQGVEYYKDAADDQFVPGLMHVNLGGEGLLQPAGHPDEHVLARRC